MLAHRNQRFLVQATSVPISIPSQMKRRETQQDQPPAEPTSSTFVPPHHLAESQQDASRLLLEGSLPFSSSSRLRNRDIVLRSTGFLPKNHTEGFRLARTTSINGAARSVAAESLSGQLPAPHSAAGHAGDASASAPLHAGGEGAVRERATTGRTSRLTQQALEPLCESISAGGTSSLRSIVHSIREQQSNADGSEA